MEELEEYLYCSWRPGIVGNVQWVCLWLEQTGNWGLCFSFYEWLKDTREMWNWLRKISMNMG